MKLCLCFCGPSQTQLLWRGSVAGGHRGRGCCLALLLLAPSPHGHGAGCVRSAGRLGRV